MSGIMKKLFSTAVEHKVKDEVEKRPSILKLMAATPDDFKLEAWVENEELIITVKRKEK